MDNQIAVVMLSTGTHHKISEETYNHILEASVDDLIRLPSGATFKVSAIMEILSIEDFEKQHPEKISTDYHQPYSYQPNLQLQLGKGFEGIVKSTPSRGLEQMIKGLKKFIGREEQQGSQVPKARALLQHMETTLKEKHS